MKQIMSKEQQFLDAIIALRTEEQICNTLQISELKKNIKSSMLKMVEHLMLEVTTRQNNALALKKPAHLITYSINSANQGNHVRLNGVLKTHCRFTLFNDALKIVQVDEKGSNFKKTQYDVDDHTKGQYSPLSTVAFTKDAFDIIQTIYSNEIQVVKDTIEKEKEIVTSAIKSSKRKQINAWIYNHIMDYSSTLQELVNAKDLLDNEPYLSDDDKELLIQCTKQVEIYDLTILLLDRLMIFVDTCSEQFVNYLYNFVKQTNDIEWWNEKLQNNDEFKEHLINLAAQKTQTQDQTHNIEHAIREITLPLHVNVDSIKHAIQQTEDKIEKLSTEKNPWTKNDIEKNEKHIITLKKLITDSTKCEIHDNCSVSHYTYTSKEDGCGRLYNAKSPQGLPKWIRQAALPRMYACDIETGVFSVLRYVAVCIDPCIISGLPVINDYIANKKQRREELAIQVFENTNTPVYAQIKMIKSAITSIGFGGTLSCTIDSKGRSYQAIGDAFNVEQYKHNKIACEAFIKSNYIRTFYAEFQIIKQLICDTFSENNDILGGYPFTKDKDTELLAHVYQGIESKILRKILGQIEMHDGERGYPFNKEKSVLPVHDGLCTNWKLDDSMLNSCIIGVLGNEHPEYLPKFENTLNYNPEIRKLILAEQYAIQQQHSILIRRQELLAKDYIGAIQDATN